MLASVARREYQEFGLPAADSLPLCFWVETAPYLSLERPEDSVIVKVTLFRKHAGVILEFPTSEESTC